MYKVLPTFIPKLLIGGLERIITPEKPTCKQNPKGEALGVLLASHYILPRVNPQLS